MGYVKRHWRRLDSMKCSKSDTLEQAINLKRSMTNPTFLSRQALVACFFGARIRAKARRKQAQIINTCLNQWAIAGRLNLLLKRVAIQVRSIQNWWKRCSNRLRAILSRISRRWQRIEREELVKAIKREEWKAKQRDERLANVDADMLPNNLRIAFLEQELRARRYRHLPRIYLWEEEYANWKINVQEWQYKRYASNLLHSEAHLDRPLFAFPPQCASYLPTDEDLLQMVERARSRPHHDGWAKNSSKSPISSDTNSPRNLSSQKKKRHKKGLSRTAKEEDLVEEDIPSMIVMGIAEAPIPTAALEGTT